MTVGEIKEIFKQVRKAQIEIRHILRLIEREELTLLPKAIRYDRDKVQVSPDDILARSAAEIADMKEELGKSFYMLRCKMGYAESLIAKLDDTDEREVLRYYYLDNNASGGLMTWAEVAEIMGFNERTIYRLHGSALVHLSEKLS